MKYEYWFANLKGITNSRKIEIRRNFQSAKELFYIEEKELDRYGLSEKEREIILGSTKVWDVEREYQKVLDKRVRCVSIWDEEYPKRLKEIHVPPYMLYVKGKLPEERKKTVAIVGARECSPYGEAMAREFASCLAGAGVQIVSGMARGVDSAGQKGALNVGGVSFGVLGCGVDLCYPREEIGLYMELQQKGGVLSEFPINTSPLKQNFPARNRIISGLSDIILVIEAKEKSGSLITADMALEQGKDVYALPGPINSELSKGCNGLIKQGAGILLSPEELLIELGIYAENSREKTCEEKILLETVENIVYSCLDFKPQNLSELIRKTKLSVPELLDVLVRLELLGVIKEVSKNYYAKVK